MKESHRVEESIENKTSTMSSIIFQIILIDIVFSFDSILTAVGMTNGIESALSVMIIAVIISMTIMMDLANPVNESVNANPSIQMLALVF